MKKHPVARKTIIVQGMQTTLVAQENWPGDGFYHWELEHLEWTNDIGEACADHDWPKDIQGVHRVADWFNPKYEHLVAQTKLFEIGGL